MATRDNILSSGFLCRKLAIDNKIRKKRIASLNPGWGLLIKSPVITL